MKISADYRMLALDALRGKWKTAVLTGIAASALGATIVSSSNSVVSNSNQAKDIHFNLFAQPNGGRLLAVLLVGIGLVCKIVDMVHSTNTDKLKDYKLILSICVSGLAISWWLFFMDLINIIGY